MRKLIFEYRKLKRTIRVGVYRICSRSPNSLICRAILTLKKKRICKIRKFEDVSKASFINYQSSEAEIAAPVFYPEFNIRNYKSHFPELKFHVIDNAMVNTHASQVAVEAGLALSDYRLKNIDRIPAISSRISYYENDLCICSSEIERVIDNGIFIDGDGSFNWFHFMVECLPKAFAATMLPTQFREYPLIVPPNYKTNNTFREAIDIFKCDRQVIVLEKNQKTMVRSLLYFDDISSSPYNMKKGIWPILTDYCQHDEFMKNYAENLKNKLGVTRENMERCGHRLFIIRSGSRRNYNQDQLLDIAKNYDFTMICPETMTLREQAKVFSEAKFVIGASGAAWTNLLFMRPSVKGLTWLFPQYAEFCSYSTLAHLLGQELIFISAQPKARLESTAAAYAEDYTVDPKMFEAALCHMLGTETP